MCDKIDSIQFGGLCGTPTTGFLVELTHLWYETTGKLKLKTNARVVRLDFGKAFDLINHHLLLEKMQLNGIPPHMYIKARST